MGRPCLSNRSVLWVSALLGLIHRNTVFGLVPKHLCFNLRRGVATTSRDQVCACRTPSQLQRSKRSVDEEDSVPGVRFLGRGPNAIVRPGCVLVAPKNEFHHYYRQSAIFVYAMGEEETDVATPTQEAQYIIRGLIIDHPTPFTLAEMMEDNPTVLDNPLGKNFLFRGGDKGKDGVILLHNNDIVQGQAVGDSGVFQGGWQLALQQCATGSADVESFKAFFNYCEFTEQELEDLLDSEEDGDSWTSVEVGAEFILDPDWDRGDAWRRLRNTLKQMDE